MADLPPPNTKRWVVRRKAAVLAAIRSGEISAEEARGRYGLSEEELQSWQRAFDTYGLSGLRVTRRPASRNRRPRRGKPRG